MAAQGRAQAALTQIDVDVLNETAAHGRAQVALIQIGVEMLNEMWVQFKKVVLNCQGFTNLAYLIMVITDPHDFQALLYLVDEFHSNRITEREFLGMADSLLGKYVNSGLHSRWHIVIASGQRYFGHQRVTVAVLRHSLILRTVLRPTSRIIILNRTRNIEPTP